MAGVFPVREDSAHPFYVMIWYGGTPEERKATPANTFVRSEGMTVTLEDGTSYEDWTGQAAVNNIGMGRPEVAKVLADQAIRMSWISPGEFAEVRLALTRDLLSILPRGLTIPFYGVGGSDSIEAAVRAARKVTRRKRVLTFRGAYHGDTMTVESVSGTGVMPYGDPRPWAVHMTPPYAFWQKGDDWERAFERSLHGMEATLKRLGPRTFACIVLEPVNVTMGAVPLSAEFSHEVRELCDRYGIKLVADEVITGFGRTGEWFGSQTVGLQPDALVLGKGLTGGYAPLGAAVFERAWGEELRKTGFPHGLTFGSHPLGCAAARETIRILKAERLVERSKAMGDHLRRRFEEIARELEDRVRDVRGHGLLVGVEIRANGRARKRGVHPAWPRVEKIWKGLRKDGIRVWISNDGSTIMVFPAFTVTQDQVDRFAERLRHYLVAN